MRRAWWGRLGGYWAGGLASIAGRFPRNDGAGYASRIQGIGDGVLYGGQVASPF